jgi:hypothetical protein
VGDDATNEAASEAKAPVEKKRSLLHRIPTPLIVTLVGVALTAWLLPAFTKQWDDRQKARDLKAAIEADMASATADALTGGDTVVTSQSWAHPTFKAPAAETKWARTSLEIQAKLQTYLLGQGRDSVATIRGSR